MLRKRLSTGNSVTLKIRTLNSGSVNLIHRVNLMGLTKQISKQVLKLPISVTLRSKAWY